VAFIDSSDEFEWPNIQYHFLPVAINYNGSNAVKEYGFQAHVGSMRSSITWSYQTEIQRSI
jgi:choline dehydrogenase